MVWRVEVLTETVAAEIAALPADMQARFLRLAEPAGETATSNQSSHPNTIIPFKQK